MKFPPTDTVSLMSDAKWRKLFGVIAQNSRHVSSATWKIINETSPVQGWLPSAADIWDSAVDGCLNGPIDFKMIEWIEIPRTVPFRPYDKAPLSYRTQNIEVLAMEIEALGQFPLEWSGENIRIYGYRRTNA